MKKTKIGKWLALIGTSLAMVFSFILATGGGILSDKSDDLSGKDRFVAQAAGELERPAGATFARLPNGSSYAYTDKSKVASFRAGSITSDLTAATVAHSDNNSNHGTAANPFVIETAADWENMVKYVSTGATKAGTGKVFVLAKDIDFSDITTFRFIPYFNGCLYGMGHKLTNIKANVWQYWNGSAWANVGTATQAGFGLIGTTSNATITDLIIEKYQYSKMPNTSYTPLSWGNFYGGIVGVTGGTTNILNCHAEGSITSSISGQYAWDGGIVGMQSGKGLVVYRCSAEYTASVACGTSHHTHHGGLIGDVYMKGGASFFDCVANCTGTFSGASPNIGGLVGYIRQDASLSFENVVSYIKISNSLSAGHRGAFVGLTNVTVLGKNLYVINGGSSMPFVDSGVSSVSQITVGPSITGSPSGTAVKSTHNAVIDAAKSAVGTTLSDKIWDKNKFTTAGMGTFTPDKSPVRNYLTQVPRDLELEYTGEDVRGEIAKADWYVDAVHGNADIMTIAYPSGGMINANADGYSVTFNLKDGFTWSDGTTGPKTIKVVVKPKRLSLSWDTSGGVAVAKISGGLAAKDVSNPPEIVNTYYKDGAELSGMPETVGTYTVKATIAPGGNYKLKDNETDADPEFTFQLTAIPITTPTVSGEVSKQYTGEDIVFTLVNDEAINNGKIVEITQDDMPAGATFKKEGNVRTITVKTAGAYRIRFTLVDQTNNCWGDGGGVLNLTVTPRPLNLTAERAGGKNWQFETNTQEQFTITHDAVDGDNIALTVSYIKPDETTVTVGPDKLTTTGKTTTVTLDPFDKGTYKILVGIAAKAASNDNGNYSLVSRIEQEVTVVGKSIAISDADIIWRYSDGQSIADLTDNMEIPYTGRTMTASIDTRNLAEKGVRVSSYSDETGLNVGDHTTVVTLTRLNDTYEFADQTFRIRWKIVQAKFDLTNVKWDYDGPIGYTGSWITVKLLNVPADLSVSYTGNRDQKVTGSGSYRADVTFGCTNPNYVVPKNGDVSTYDYKGDGDFPWTLFWQIKKGVIDTNWDFYAETHTDKEGNVFNYPTLIGGRDRVDYVFYEATRTPSGDYEQGAEIALDDITAKAGSELNYFVEAVLRTTAEDNFELATGNNPIRFTIGQNKTPVRVTITQSGGMYDGNPKPVEFTFDVTQTAIPLTKDDFTITYLDENGIPLTGAPTDAGAYKMQFAINGLPSDDYYVHGGSVFDFTISKCVIDVSNVAWDYSEPFVFERHGDVETLYTVKLAGLPSTVNITYSDNAFSAVGKYKATFTLGELDKDNYEEFTLPASLNELNWEIKTRELKVPKQIVQGLVYDGNERDLIALCELDEDWENYITVSVKKGAEAISGTTVTDAGTYVVVCTVLGSLHNSVIWANKQTVDQSCSIIISPRVIKVVGWQGKPSLPVFDEGASSSMYQVVYKDASENVVANPADGLHYGERFRATVEVPAGMAGNVLIVYDEAIKNYDEFIIFDPSEAPKLLQKPELQKAELEYNFEEQTFVIKNWRDYKDWINVLDSLTMENVGKRTVRVALKNDKNVMWDDLSYDIYELEITITRARIEEVWDKTQSPPVLSFEGMDVVFDMDSIIEYEFYDADGTPVKAGRLKEGVEYEVVARIKDDYAGLFGFGKDLEVETPYTFIYGELEEPTPPGPKPPEENIDPPSENTNELPLWQLIVGGISAVLFIICASKAFGEYGKLKAAKKEAKELAEVSYAVTYSFVPAGLMAISFLGAGENIWTAVACSLAGLFVISFAAMLLLSKKRKAAELVVRREKARIEEEKEYSRMEAQQRRDEEMKMMFAAMQQNYQQPQMQYDDMRSLLAETVSALLPAMQQQMQALPPAGDALQYAAPAAPQQYAAPAYGAPAPAYGAPASGEADELRAQMAQQQAQMAQQQAQMAQQQELINQLLQNQQAGQSAAAPVSEEYDEAAIAQDEAYWLDASDEVVSLEELYGRLNDDAKRCYYEIGSYIMGKPKTSQNDGKYAVLFRYRGKTLFKLCIKDDAPVLYYLTESGKEEVRIADASSLDIAKRVVDRNLIKRDSELS